MKLAINQPGDHYEQEADRIADQVMATPTHHTVSGVPSRIQRFVEQVTGEMDTAPASVGRVLASSGRPLDPTLQQDMGRRFGHDFSRVRVHSGPAAEQSTREVHAHAYTVGHNIVFGAGRFAPETHQGQWLIAHELTHVVQQSGSDGIRADLGNEKRALSPFSLQQQVAARPFLLCRAPGDGKPSPPVVSPPSISENQARLAELLIAWVPPAKQRLTTISRAEAIELKTGRRVYLVAVAGESGALPLDPSILRPDEVLVPYENTHAEIQTMRFAPKNGYKLLPGALEPSRAFCTNCAWWARKYGLAPPDAKVLVGNRERPLAEVSNSELTKNLDVERKPGWRGELTELGKAKRAAKSGVVEDPIRPPKGRLAPMTPSQSGSVIRAGGTVGEPVATTSGTVSVPQSGSVTRAGGTVGEPVTTTAGEFTIPRTRVPGIGRGLGVAAAHTALSLVLNYIFSKLIGDLDEKRIQRRLEEMQPEIQAAISRREGEVEKLLQQTSMRQTVYANVQVDIIYSFDIDPDPEAGPMISYQDTKFIGVDVSTQDINREDWTREPYLGGHNDHHLYTHSVPIAVPAALVLPSIQTLHNMLAAIRTHLMAVRGGSAGEGVALDELTVAQEATEYTRPSVFQHNTAAERFYLTVNAINTSLSVLKGPAGENPAIQGVMGLLRVAESIVNGLASRWLVIVEEHGQ